MTQNASCIPGWKLRYLCPWSLAPNTSFSKSWVSFNRIGGKHRLSVWGIWQCYWTERNIQHEINNSWSPSEWDCFSFVLVRGAWGWASYCVGVTEYMRNEWAAKQSFPAVLFLTPPFFSWIFFGFSFVSYSEAEEGERASSSCTASCALVRSQLRQQTLLSQANMSHIPTSLHGFCTWKAPHNQADLLL